VKTIADKLKHKGTVSRGWIGVEVQSVSPEIVEGLGLNKPVYGVLVAEIQLDSPAAKAGIMPGGLLPASRPATIAS
jgi:serine protease Do